MYFKFYVRPYYYVPYRLCSKSWKTWNFHYTMLKHTRHLQLYSFKPIKHSSVIYEIDIPPDKMWFFFVIYLNISHSAIVFRIKWNSCMTITQFYSFRIYTFRCDRGIFPRYSWFENVLVYNFICWENYSENVSRIKHIQLSNTPHISYTKMFVHIWISCNILYFHVSMFSTTVLYIHRSKTMVRWYIKSGYCILILYVCSYLPSLLLQIKA